MVWDDAGKNIKSKSESLLNGHDKQAIVLLFISPPLLCYNYIMTVRLHWDEHKQEI